MDKNLMKLLIEKLSSDWKRFGRLTCLANVVDYIEHDYTDEKQRMEEFLVKFFQRHPKSYKIRIKRVLRHLNRYDVLQDSGFSVEPEASYSCLKEEACICLKEKAEDATQHSLPLYKNMLPEDKKVFAIECSHCNFERIIKGRIPKDKEVKIYIVDTSRQSAIVNIERLCNWICEWFFNFDGLQGCE